MSNHFGRIAKINRWFGLCLVALLVVQPAAAESFILPEGVEPEVLLITDESLAEAWEEFAHFKTRLGRPTLIVTVQTIADSYEGDDIQAKIRACVLDYIETHGTQFIILGGDSDAEGAGLVPDRDTLHREMRYRDIPSDLYYLSPGENDWDADGDGVFGEWDRDMEAVQYGHPSGAAIGRIPVRSAADVAAYTDKIIDYETAYPEADFAEGIIYSNTVEASERKVRRSWDDYLSNAWEAGEIFRFYHTETSWDGEDKGDYALNTSHWLDVINNQTAGKMHMHGHGMQSFWVLEDDGGHSLLNQDIVDQLTNENAYMVMTTVSCFTGQYDGGDDPCITESMLRAPNRGAVVVIAPSREGVPIFHNPREDFRLMMTEGKLDGTTESMTRFWINGLSPREDGSYLTGGQAFIAIKQEMESSARQTAGYHWCQCELNFLGDPTLDLRAKDPCTVEVAEIAALMRSDSPMDLMIETDLRQRPGAVACLWKAGEVYQVVAVDDDGSASFTGITFKSAGEVLITISGPSVNAYLGSIEVR